MQKDVTVAETAPGGMGAYRTALAASFLYKTLIATCLSLAGADASPGKLNGASNGASNGANNGHAESAPPQQFAWIGDAERSAVVEAHPAELKGVQFFAEAKPNAIVGRPERHRAAHLQVLLLTLRLPLSLICTASCDL